MKTETKKYPGTKNLKLEMLQAALKKDGWGEIAVEEISRIFESHEALLDALKTWQKFWDTMPKGQMGKLSFDVGLFNDGFVKMAAAIAQAERK